MGLVGLGNMGQGMAANLLQSAAKPEDVRGMYGGTGPHRACPACFSHFEVVSFCSLTRLFALFTPLTHILYTHNCSV